MLDDAWDDTPSEANKLRETLRERERSARAVISGGSKSSVSSNSRSQGYSNYGPGSVTMVEEVEAWRYLVDLFDQATAELGGTPNDAAVYTQMMADLREVCSVTSNFMYLSK